MTKKELKHVAYSFVHSGFDPWGHGGCSCEICCKLRGLVQNIRLKEAREYVEAKKERSRQTLADL